MNTVAWPKTQRRPTVTPQGKESGAARPSGHTGDQPGPVRVGIEDAERSLCFRGGEALMAEETKKFFDLANWSMRQIHKDIVYEILSELPITKIEEPGAESECIQ